MPFNYLLSFFFFALALLAYRKLKLLRSLEATCRLTQAEIIRKEVIEGKFGKLAYWLYYRYEAMEGKAQVGYRLYDKAIPGDSLEIMVETAKPEVSFLRGIFLDRVSSYQALAMLLLGCAVGVPWLI